MTEYGHVYMSINICNQDDKRINFLELLTVVRKTFTLQ